MHRISELRPSPIGRLIATACIVAMCSCSAPSRSSGETVKQRTIVLTDIGHGDPDDVQSMIRLLLYSNDLELEGLIATASQGVVDPEQIRELIETYGEVRPNLVRHAPGYPAKDHLLSLVRTGARNRGMESVGAGKSTEASRHIISVVDKPDPRPIWVQVWGAPTDLAQALWDVRDSRSKALTGAFVARLRVYDIAGQDETGAWICHNFPGIRWLRSIDQFQAISVRMARPFPPEVTGANIETFTTEWVEENIRSHGPLGRQYIERIYKYEGDTPAFLHLLPNGLSDPEQIDQGNWGGRFNAAKTRNPLCFGRWREKQEPFLNFFMNVEAGDTWTYESVTYENSVHAALFRWREAFQNDFAARMDWSITGARDQANHNPVAAIDKDTGREVLHRKVTAGSEVSLSADGTTDPDGDRLAYRWFHYPEPGSYEGKLSITGANANRASFQAPPTDSDKTIHIILEVTDSGSPRLYSYRRLIFTVTP